MITLRPITDHDLPFLRALYGSTRQAELTAVPWNDAQKAQFLDMQFHAQHTHYQTTYPQATFDIIEKDGAAIGRLYIDPRPDEIRIVDIALLPAHQNAGIGSALLQHILDDGAANGRCVTIHVERFNPALRLYERLGFQHVADNGVYLLMSWTPQSAPALA